MSNRGIKQIYDYWLDWNFCAKIISMLVNVILCTIATLVLVNY